MPGPLPTTIITPPAFRLLTRTSWGGTLGLCQTSAADWTEHDEPSQYNSNSGMELLKIKRVALPQVGEASFRFVYGALPIQTPAAPELTYQEVRLQLFDPVNGWHTQFWGQVIGQEFVSAVASDTPFGVVIYHCVDGAARMMKWPLNYSGYDSGGEPNGSYFTMGPVRGHPGYNYQLASDGPLLGNKSPNATYTQDGVQVSCHGWQGAFAVVASNPTLQTTNKWTELEMINHACAAVKPDGEPLFTMPDSTPTGQHGFDCYSAQPVYDNEPVFDVVARITNRQRGKGTVIVDWIDDMSGALEVFFTYTPLTKSDIVYTIPGTSGSTATIQGAENAGQVYTEGPDDAPILDLRDDARNIDDAFSYTDAAAHVFDELDTVGEKIEVAATLCMYDGAGDAMTDVYDGMSYSLQPRWSPTDVYGFLQLDTPHRTQPYWNFIFQTFGLPRFWAGLAGNGINTDKQRVDYRTLSSGEIYCPDPPSGMDPGDPPDTAANLVELLPYLPLYEGYSYSGAPSAGFPKKTDNSQQFGLPQRRAIMLLLRPSGWADSIYVGYDEDRWFLPGGQLPQVVTNEKVYPQRLGDFFSPSVTVQPDGIITMAEAATRAGVRIIGDPVQDESEDTDNKLGSVIPITRLAMTVGLRLPHRVFMASFNYGTTQWPTSRKRKVIYIENTHLWLVAANCIYDLSQTDVDLINAQGYSPMRNALGSTDSAPAIVRDDRPLLARYHALASEWYLNPRTKVTFGAQMCGFLNYTYELDGYIAFPDIYPQLGQFIDQIYIDGSAEPVGTCVTSVEYDHQAFTTRWETDYFDLDMK